MSTKNIHTIEFLCKRADLDSWSKKFLLSGKHKGYKKLFVSSGSMSGLDWISTQEEYENALQGGIDLNEIDAPKKK